MGLTLPLALLSLGLASIPLWIHRVRRKQLREQPLPTISLLRRAVSRRRRSLSFLDRPLLLARLLLVALFALALSRPYLARVVSYKADAPIALAVVIDDSMSMNRSAKDADTLLAAAVERARTVLGELAPRSEVSITLAGAPPRLLHRRTGDVDAVRERLSPTDPPGGRGTAMEAAIAMAVRDLSGTRLPHQEVLVLTDCAAHAQLERTAAVEASLRFECLEPNEPAEPNAYFESVSLKTAQAADEPATLFATVTAGAGMDALRLLVEVDGSSVQTARVELAGGTGGAELALPAERLRDGKLLTVRIATENAIAEDDVRVLPLGDLSNLTALLVDGDPAPNRLDDELRFLSLALSFDSASYPPPRVVRVDADGLAATDLTPFDVVMLANVRAPDQALAEKLERYVEAGGGLFISAGDHVDAFAYRGTLGPLLPAVPRSDAPASPALTLDVAKPPRDPLVPEQGRGLSTCRTQRRLLVEAPGPDARTLLSFEDGTPLLLGAKRGRGQVALFTTTVDDDWTDLPLTPGFLPLAQGIVRGLSAVDALPTAPLTAGHPVKVRVPAQAKELYWTRPDGQRLDVPVAQPSAELRQTSMVGYYRAHALLEGQGVRELKQMSFNVVAAVEDSDLTPGTAPTSTQSSRPQSIAAPRGVEPWLWLAFGILLIAEGLLRARPKTTAALQPG